MTLKEKENRYLKVVIIGPGWVATIGIALRKAGYEVEIYDRVSGNSARRAGISLWSNGVKGLWQV